MGKFLESLRQTAIRSTQLEAPIDRTDALAPNIEADEADEEIPFIEVGPHKSMDASASVLATRPHSTAPAVTFRPSPAEVTPRRPHFASEIIAHKQPDHPVSSQYCDLLDALMAASGDGAKALLFAPGLPDADAAAVLLNLAVTYVRHGSGRVIVVDADLRRPALADRLGLAERPGFGDVLSGLATLEQALQITEMAQLAILAAGGPTPTGLRLVVETPATLLRKLRLRCDLLFVRGASWEDGGEALAAVCDVAYLVLPEREAASPRVDELLQTLPRHGGRLGGCILAAE